jgi:hypothetical protein
MAWSDGDHPVISIISGAISGIPLTDTAAGACQTYTIGPADSRYGHARLIVENDRAATQKGSGGRLFCGFSTFGDGLLGLLRFLGCPCPLSCLCRFSRLGRFSCLCLFSLLGLLHNAPPATCRNSAIQTGTAARINCKKPQTTPDRNSRGVAVIQLEGQTQDWRDVAQIQQ